MYAQIALALASAAYKYKEASDADKEAKAEAARAPKSVMPESAKVALAESENLAKGRSAGALAAEKSLAESAATKVYRSERSSTSPAQVQASLSGAQALESKGIRQIAAAEEGETTARKSQYIDQLYKMASIEQGIDESNKENAWNIEQGIKATASQQKYDAIRSGVNIGITALGEVDGGDGGELTTALKNDITPKTVGDINLAGAGGAYQTYLKSGGVLSFEEWQRT